MSMPASRDSDLYLLPIDSGMANLPAAASRIPTLSLNSTGPLPFLNLPTGANSATESPTNRPSAANSAITVSPDGTIWLEGTVLMCGCPECDAPMTIRLWLMVADCWRCGTSIELTEEQEKEIQRLLDRREAKRPAADENRKAPTPATTAPATPRSTSSTPARPAPVATPAASSAAAAASVSPPRERASPAASPNQQQSQRQGTVSSQSQSQSAALAAPPPAPVQPAAPRPEEASPTSASASSPTAQKRRQAAPPVQRRKGQMHPLDRRARALAAMRRQPRWWEKILREVPAWLVSLVFHMVLLTLLALFTFREEAQGLFITLSTVASREKAVGEFKVKVDNNDEIVFDLPIPDNINLKDKKKRDALIEANQIAKDLRLDPNDPLPQLPNLESVKLLAASSDPIRRSLAVRDPRLRVEVAKKEGGTTLTEAAVARALRWLSEQQSADGSWTGGPSPPSAQTALALLPFLGAGQTHMAGRYQDTVSKGLRWMLKQQKENGDLRAGVSSHGMYIHGIAAIVLCDAFAMTGDENLRLPAQRGLDFIVEAQNVRGGWRYTPKEPGDLSVVGWQLMALQSGKMGGLKVPPETLELADHFLDSVSSDSGSKYSYLPKATPTNVMTAEGLLSRMYLGWNQGNPGLRKGVTFLDAQHPPKTGNIYYIYYGTQVMHHFGGEPWEKWNRRLRDLLVESQVTSGANAGSWSPDGDQYGSKAGRIYQTSLSACTLEVYYRHAPIFRKIKLD